MNKAIIFDADGMIIHGERFSARLEKEFGISTSITGEFFKTEFQDCLIGKKDLKEVLPKYVKEWGWKGTVEELMSFWFDKSANQADDRFEKVVRELRANGIKCYLATNNEKYRTENFLADRNMGTWFDGVIASWEAGAKKPEPEFFDFIIKKTGLNKENVEFWDDDPENIEGARASGLDAKLYDTFENFSLRIKPYLQ